MIIGQGTREEAGNDQCLCFYIIFCKLGTHDTSNHKLFFNIRLCTLHAHMVKAEEYFPW
jgi:hypothetical protein